MTSPTLLGMAAANNGFDREVPRVEGWLAYASSRAPLRIWLQERGDAGAVVALSQGNVAQALEDQALLTDLWA